MKGKGKRNERDGSWGRVKERQKATGRGRKMKIECGEKDKWNRPIRCINIRFKAGAGAAAAAALLYTTTFQILIICCLLSFVNFSFTSAKRKRGTNTTTMAKKKLGENNYSANCLTENGQNSIRITLEKLLRIKIITIIMIIKSLLYLPIVEIF